MKLDNITQYNQSRWEELARADVLYSRPWEDLDRDSARARLDPQGVLGAVEGKQVLCLANGGGQQSAAFALMGAQVTVVDFAATQLARDQETATFYGVSIQCYQEDMRDLSFLAGQNFDIVWQAYSINYVPDIKPVIAEVSRVLKPGGFYRLDFANPYVMGMDERSYDGNGYPLRLPYIDGAEIQFDHPKWELWDEKGARKLMSGPRQYRHTLSKVTNMVIGYGFNILRLWEDIHAPDQTPGTWDHFTYIAPPIITLWMQLVA
jgi:ubiquinone/menaquinone biosynthesis C-methylase UbiE